MTLTHIGNQRRFYMIVRHPFADLTRGWPPERLASVRRMALELVAEVPAEYPQVDAGENPPKSEADGAPREPTSPVKRIVLRPAVAWSRYLDDSAES